MYTVAQLCIKKLNIFIPICRHIVWKFTIIDYLYFSKKKKQNLIQLFTIYYNI